ncbi:MAG: hypothetical protein M0Z41_11680 [Peptococcaceae bacterium]|jgi:hypothetical protein|nr:hypothetical protein [Peptococcaceae bacterium]
MAKSLRDGASYGQRDVLDLLVEFSSFKDRVSKKFTVLSKELEGKPNEHELWVNLYLISTDYADETVAKKLKQESLLQKIS